MLKTDKNIALPPHWKVVKLGEACEITLGQSPPSSAYNSEALGLPFFQGKKEFTELYPVAVKWCSKPIRIAEPNDILLSVRAPVGATNIANMKCCIGRGLAAIRYKPNYKYLYYYLRSINRELDMQGTGSTFRAVSGNIIRSFRFPIPSFPEQHRIVSKIEELFSELDNGIANLKKTKDQLKVYRQSVLKWAFEGRLTNKDVKNGKLPEGWRQINLMAVCNKIQDGSHFSPQVQYKESGENRFMYITAKNIRNNYMDFRKLSYADKDFHDSIYGRCDPEYGDVLLTKDGANTGQVTLNTIHEPFSLLSSVCLFKTKKDYLNNSFLKYFIQSPLGHKAILGSMTGTAIKRIILKKIKEAQIYLPTIKEQVQIVQEIESRLSVADKLEETIEQSLKQSEALRQSILKRAFEGKLVPQDPNDEAVIISHVTRDVSPEFIEGDIFKAIIPTPSKVMFKANVRLSSETGTPELTIEGAIEGAIEGVTEGVTEGVRKKLTLLLSLIIRNEGKRIPFYAKELEIPEKTVEGYIKRLRDANLIKFSEEEATKVGGYYIAEKLKKKINK